MDETTQDKILYQIKRLGPMPAKALAEKLGITTMGIRQHLAQLEQQALVRAGDPAPQARGRPVSTWHLTDRGHSRFPDAHAQVTVELITNVRDLLGEEALDTIIGNRAREALDHYKRTLSKQKSLKQKCDELGRLRSEEGYMAEIERISDTEYLLVENHCPICIAAKTCQGFCSSELETFQALFDDADVTREEYLLDGGRRCSYRIKSRK